jgi:CIC family chloride channel protein
MGAMLGSAYGAVAHGLAPHVALAAGAYGVVGMAAAFAATTRAPFTAVLIILELTGEFHIALPLMVAVAVATAVSRAVSRDTIYTLKLRRRGIEIDQADTGIPAPATPRAAERGHTARKAARSLPRVKPVLATPLARR